MKQKKVLIIGFLVSVFSIGNAQIKISELVQESKIASSDANKLYFVDFWATWCVPCHYAKEHLKVVQKQFNDDLYIVSLSEENSSKVKRFLEGKPTDLAIAIDNYGETFERFNIKPLPQGILFNAKGKKLWQGHSADLKAELIKRFLRQSNTTSSLSDFVEIVVDENESSTDYIPTETVEVKSIPTSNNELLIVDNSAYLKLTGSLKDVVSYLSKIYREQIEMSSKINSNYEVYIKKPFTEKDNVAYKLINDLGYSIQISEVKGDVLALTLNEPQFWDSKQIEWGNDAKYLIGDDAIMADNVSLKDMSYQLSKVLDIPIVITDEDERSLKEHDWQIHYKYFELMSSSLLDYGISIKKEISNFPKYTITKKAP